MRSVYNAVTDVVNELRLANQVDEHVYPDRHNPSRWIVRFMSKPGSLIFFVLEVEIMDEPNNDPTICVMHRVGLSTRTMERLMNSLEEALREVPALPPSPPPGGAPARR